MNFVYDAGGTGFSREMVARDLNQPARDQYLSGGLGDEIMLLDGLEDLGYSYPDGYDVGPASAYTPPWNGQSTYDWGVDGFQLGLGGPIELTGEDYRYVGLGVGKLGSTDYRYVGLGNPRPRGRFGLRASMATRKASLMGLGAQSYNAGKSFTPINIDPNTVRTILNNSANNSGGGGGGGGDTDDDKDEEESDNTMLYVGIGVAVLGVLYFMKK